MMHAESCCEADPNITMPLLQFAEKFRMGGKTIFAGRLCLPPGWNFSTVRPPPGTLIDILHKGETKRMRWIASEYFFGDPNPVPPPCHGSKAAVLVEEIVDADKPAGGR